MRESDPEVTKVEGTLSRFRRSMYNYNPPAEDAKTLSPFTYYQPFQSSFDPDFSVPGAKTLRRQPPQGKRWVPGGGTFGGLRGPSGGAPSPPERDVAGSCPRPPPRSNPFPRASTSLGWGEAEGRSVCNSTWRGRPSFSGEGPSGGCSRFAPTGEGSFGGNFRGVSPPNTGSGARSYYPLVLSPLAKTGGYKSGHNQRPMVCNFCKNNKEVPDIYLNHYLYDPETKVLSCPVLRKHVCEICGGTGDQAHTLQYCPVNRERGLQSKVPVLLKTRTITNSTGKIRRN